MEEATLPTSARDQAPSDSSAELLAQVGAAGSIEVVQIDDLHVDPAYQRDLSRDLVERIKKSYDAAAAGPIVVSRRSNGDLYIVNGQHRTAAAREAGRSEMLAQVINGLDRAQEAELRLMGNTRRSDSSQERFRAQIAAGNPESIAIMRIVEQFDSRVNPAPQGKSGINSVSALEAIYRRDGSGTLLTRTLETVRSAFGELGGKNVTVNVLNGVAWLLERHSHEEIDRKRLIERLHESGLDEIERVARGYRAALGGSLWLNFYRAMVDAYNYRLTEAQRVEHRTGGYGRARKEGSMGSTWG